MEEISNFFTNSVYAGTILVFITYGFGLFLQHKTHFFLFNPLLISVGIIIPFLLIFKIDYSCFDAQTEIFDYLLTPATICLAIPLYQQFQKLKDNWKAILAGIISGVLANLLFIFLMSLVFGLGHEEYVSLLPKSITTAIGIALSSELGGSVPVTIVMIVITGNMGNIFAPVLLKLFRITEPVAKGVAIGTSSHALGTAKALEMGEVEGAMSGLSIAVTGLLTVAGASIFAQFI